LSFKFILIRERIYYIDKVKIKTLNFNRSKEKRSLVFIVVLILLLIVIELDFGNFKEKISVQLLLARGNIAYNMGDFDMAEVYYKKILKSEPVLWNVNYNLGNVYYKEGRYKEATQLYIHNLQTNSKGIRAETWNNLGNSFYMLGNLKMSLMAYKAALLINNNDAEIKQNFLFVANKIDQLNQLNSNKNKGKSSENGKKSSDNSKSNSDNNKREAGKRGQSSANSELSDKNIVDLFNKINQNEDNTRGKIGRTKLNNASLPSNEPDY
jgi:tetratricopeptide (TPR) repeat protein